MILYKHGLEVRASVLSLSVGLCSYPSEVCCVSFMPAGDYQPTNPSSKVNKACLVSLWPLEFSSTFQPPVTLFLCWHHQNMDLTVFLFSFSLKQFSALAITRWTMPNTKGYFGMFFLAWICLMSPCEYTKTLSLIFRLFPVWLLGYLSEWAKNYM